MTRRNVYVKTTMNELPRMEYNIRAQLLLEAENSLHNAMVACGDLVTNKRNTVKGHAEVIKDNLWKLNSILNKLK